MNNPNIIFLISLPRSGSTLLQKMLTAHPEIHSISEPWLMLPQAFILQKDGLRTLYSHKIFSHAMEDFIKQLPGGIEDYYSAVREFARILYGKVTTGNETKFFLDKTPRYYLIIPFLAKVFPDAKFIILFRNPLEILASILDTWFDGKFLIYVNHIDIFHGPQFLTEGEKILGGRCLALQYTDLINDPEKQLNAISSYLDISSEEALIDRYKHVKFDGAMGDPEGATAYSGVTNASLQKWKKVLNTRYRKRFAKKYVQKLGNKTLSAFNTSVPELLREVESISLLKSGSLQDALDHLLCLGKILFDGEHLPYRIKDYYRGKKVSHIVNLSKSNSFKTPAGYLTRRLSNKKEAGGVYDTG